MFRIGGATVAGERGSLAVAGIAVAFHLAAAFQRLPIGGDALAVAFVSIALHGLFLNLMPRE